MADATSISQPTATGGNVTVNSPGVVFAIVAGVVAVVVVVVVVVTRKKKKNK